jgi:predicted dehydrogenase
MEALWTRFLPVYDEVARWLQQGAIGEVRAVQSSFAFVVPWQPQDRCHDPAQAGGALLDIGIYNLAVTRWVLEQSLGRCPALRSVQAEAVLTAGGVDQRLAAQLHFEGGASAQMFCAFDTQADNGLRILGERGHIVLPAAFWQATWAQLHRAGATVEAVERPFAINGFEGEITEAMRCIRSGQVESARMPHAESLALVETMDRIRRQVGVRYPFESDAA